MKKTLFIICILATVPLLAQENNIEKIAGEPHLDVLAESLCSQVGGEVLDSPVTELETNTENSISFYNDDNFWAYQQQRSSKPVILLKDNITFYAELSGGYGRFLNLGANIGGVFYENINAEIYAYWGLVNNVMLYSYDNASYTLSPSTYGVRIGYYLPILKRLGIAPQFGAGFLTLKGDGMSVSDVTISIALRCDFMIYGGFGVSVTPEYIYGEMRDLSIISPDIAEWNKGFNVRLGLQYRF